MASLNDVTGILGEYMLKGWVLTDKSCQTCATPLMRSPRAMAKEVWFCAKCDGGPPGSATAKPTVSVHSNATTSSSNSTILSLNSPPSTPPTELSHLSEDEEEFVLPPETEESRRRREQSDRASAELGRKLLQGWAMLGDECPNDDCYGVPLVRPPNSGGVSSPRKECVICGGIYTLEEGANGQQHLQRINPPAPPAQAERQSPSSTERTVQRSREQEDAIVQQPAVVRTNAPIAAQAPSTLIESTLPQVLAETSTNLQITLRGLSTSLATSTNFQSPESISRIAQAIGDVTQALSRVEALRQSTNN